MDAKNNDCKTYHVYIPARQDLLLPYEGIHSGLYARMVLDYEIGGAW